MGVLLEPIDHSSAQEELNFVAFFDDKCSTFKNIRFSLKLHSHSVWPDLAKFCHLDKLWKILRKLLRVYFVFGKILNLLWHFLNFGQIWAVVSSQISTNNLAIWSHCFFRLMTGWLSIFKSNKDEFKVSLSRRGLFPVEFAFANFFVKKSVGVFSLKISLSKAPFRPV